MYCRPDLRSYAAILFTQTQKLSAVYDSAEVCGGSQAAWLSIRQQRHSRNEEIPLFGAFLYLYRFRAGEPPSPFSRRVAGLAVTISFFTESPRQIVRNLQVPMLRSFANRHPLAASADILALPLRKDRFCHLYPFPAKIARHIP